MLQAMLNPLGRIGPVTFRKAAVLLIALGACFSLLPVVLPGLAMLSFISLLLIYPWVVIWLKRFHDAGRPGKQFLVVLVVWLIVNGVAGYFIGAKFAPPMVPTPNPDIIAMMTARMRAVALPNTIVSVAISLAFALIVNDELKTDPAENLYGPPRSR